MKHVSVSHWSTPKAMFTLFFPIHFTLHETGRVRWLWRCTDLRLRLCFPRAALVMPSFCWYSSSFPWCYSQLKPAALCLTCPWESRYEFDQGQNPSSKIGKRFNENWTGKKKKKKKLVQNSNLFRTSFSSGELPKRYSFSLRSMAKWQFKLACLKVLWVLASCFLWSSASFNSATLSVSLSCSWARPSNSCSKR